MPEPLPAQDDITALVRAIDECYEKPIPCEGHRKAPHCTNSAHLYMLRSCGCPVLAICSHCQADIWRREDEHNGLDCRDCRAKMVHLIWAPAR